MRTRLEREAQGNSQMAYLLESNAYTGTAMKCIIKFFGRCHFKIAMKGVFPPQKEI